MVAYYYVGGIAPAPIITVQPLTVETEFNLDTLLSHAR